MNIEIRRLTPELVDDYVHFFDTTPHANNKAEHRCYCVWWCNGSNERTELTSSVEARRDYAVQFIRDGHIQGYLAYDGDRVVGWCNTNTKSDCLLSFSWRRFMGAVPADESEQGVKVKSILCFAIAPETRRKGVAGLLVERVCQDAALDGFDFVEAYPNKEFVDEADDYMGPFSLYESAGFSVYADAEQKYVMRKRLSHNSS